MRHYQCLLLRQCRHCKREDFVVSDASVLAQIRMLMLAALVKAASSELGLGGAPESNGHGTTSQGPRTREHIHVVALALLPGV